MSTVCEMGVLSLVLYALNISPPFSAPGDSSTCKQITTAETVRNVEWATDTCVLGFGVFGKLWNGQSLAEDRSSEKYP